MNLRVIDEKELSEAKGKAAVVKRLPDGARLRIRANVDRVVIDKMSDTNYTEDTVKGEGKGRPTSNP